MICDMDGYCGAAVGLAERRAKARNEALLDKLISQVEEGTKKPWNKLSASEKQEILAAGWTPGEYDDFGGNVRDIAGTYQDPALWFVGLISVGRLTPSTISFLQELLKPVNVTGTYVVYRLVENGVVRYIGITNDILRRTEQHFISRGWLIEPISGLENLSKYDARAVEQVLIEYYGLQHLYNQVNSISPNNPLYQKAIQRGTEILTNLGFFGP